MKKIMIITTGGTIAMKSDSKTGALVPAVSGADLAASAPGITACGEIAVEEFSNIPSEFMTVEKMWDMARFIEDREGEADGFVITHGTDTMEETAFFLDHVLYTDKPVVMTGAMRGASDLSADGPANILAAVRTAADSGACGRGVLVVMNQKIFTARDVEKTDAVGVDSFQAPEWGPAGIVDQDKVRWGRPASRGRQIPVHGPFPEVWLVKCAAGISGKILDAVPAAGAGGVVIEGFGCGNVPLSVYEAAGRLLKRGMPVVLVSRTQHGSIEKAYGYDGGAASLEARGCILGGSLSGQKARILLMAALAAGVSKEDMKALFEAP